jgi:acyl carrier protein
VMVMERRDNVVPARNLLAVTAEPPDVKRLASAPLASAHFLDDLGADWLDRLELVISVEDLTGLETADDQVDQIEAVTISSATLRAPGQSPDALDVAAHTSPERAGFYPTTRSKRRSAS